METHRVHEVVHHLRSKPQHIRQRIALGSAVGITLVVALGWLGAMTMNGSFSLAVASTPTVAVTTADSATSPEPSSTNQTSPFSQLMGAAGAAIGATTSAPTISVVDTKTSSTLDQPTVPEDVTVIHF